MGGGEPFPIPHSQFPYVINYKKREKCPPALTANFIVCTVMHNLIRLTLLGELMCGIAVALKIMS